MEEKAGVLDTPKGDEEDPTPKADVVDDANGDGEDVPKGLVEEEAPKGVLNAEPDEVPNAPPPNGDDLFANMLDDEEEKGFAADV